MTPQQVNTIFQRFAKNNPNPKTELIYSTPFELLIAVILSAQALDASVNKATAKLFPIANTPEKIIKLGLEGLKKHIKTIGLYNTKAKNILKTCEILTEQYHSKVPDTREDLESLPGVGRKTASVILNVAFHQAALPVDTHIFRVSNRLGLAHAKTPLETEKQLIKIIPKKYLNKAHHWLILHGRYICVARRPKCEQCFLVDLCEYPNKSFKDQK